MKIQGENRHDCWISSLDVRQTVFLVMPFIRESTFSLATFAHRVRAPIGRDAYAARPIRLNIFVCKMTCEAKRWLRGLMPSTPPGSSAVDVAKRTTSMVVGEECQLFSTILMETPLGSAENSREATEASRRHANRGSACGWLRMPAPDPTPQRCTGVFSPAHTLSSPP